eukprot:6200876-Pleurochrysis_carterae.AAC.2
MPVPRHSLSTRHPVQLSDDERKRVQRLLDALQCPLELQATAGPKSDANAHASHVEHCKNEQARRSQ